MSDNRLKLIIRLTFSILFAVLLLCLLIKDIGFSGYHEIVYTAGSINAQISKLFPESRVISSVDSMQIIDEPIYFTTRMSTKYDTARVQIKYINDCCHSLVLGMQSGDGWDYEQELLDNIDFNNLDWTSTVMDNITMWSKDDTKLDFSNLANSNNVASYNFSEGPDYLIEDYVDYKKEVTTNVNLISSFSFLVYLNNNLNITFNFSNASAKDFNVYDQFGNKILIETSSDNQYNLLMANISTGVYRVVVNTDLDNLTTSIVSKHKYINFLNQLNLASGEYSLVSNASTIRWQANDYTGLQIIKQADQEFNIKDINRKYYSNDLNEITYLEIPQGNIQIFSDGLFSFNDEYLLANIPNKISRINNDSDYDYLVAKYSKPIIENDWSINDITFDLSKATISQGKLRFIIGALGVSIDNPLSIKEIKVIYEKKSDQGNIWTEFIDYLKYCWINFR